MSERVLRRLAAFVLTLLALGGATVGGLSAAASADSSGSSGSSDSRVAPYVPPGDTIVLVQGDAANGFEIKHYDGTWLFPPTDSETMAECEEYDREIRRLRCKVSNRTWFRALEGFKETTRYYRALP
jgi:hypothetical protein